MTHEKEDTNEWGCGTLGVPELLPTSGQKMKNDFKFDYMYIKTGWKGRFLEEWVPWWNAIFQKL